ncbi:MAG: 30S ribosomal protein S7 [Planctomycetes bacterium]|jgi:small subunit ribosomal protein S7|nr:30S ribosomal protein S7 [Planctomycetota bacterium]
MAFPPRKPRHDEPTGEELQEAAAAVAGEAAAVVVNEDGSITVADSTLAKGPAPQRWTGGGVKPDGRYNSLLVSKFVNCLMYDGKKVTAEAIFYGAMKQIADKLKADPLPVFEQALENVKPLVEVRSKRIGGANYQVPVEVNRKRQQTLAIRWILEAVRTRKGRPIAEKLAQELTDCYNKTGTTIQKRENTHRMAEANKAFSHFA